MMTKTKGVRQFRRCNKCRSTSVRAAFLQWASGFESSPEIVLSFKCGLGFTRFGETAGFDAAHSTVLRLEL
jgi:hypothetical protein